MTHLETALELSTGLETSIEQLDAVITKGDIGLNDITGLEVAGEYLDEMAEQYEYESRISALGHAAKYMY